MDADIVYHVVRSGYIRSSSYFPGWSVHSDLPGGMAEFSQHGQHPHRAAVEPSSSAQAVCLYGRLGRTSADSYTGSILFTLKELDQILIL